MAGETYQSLFVDADGVKTLFIVAGQGMPIVLVHGGGPGASGEYGWWRNIPALAEHFQVFALDRIGSGLTDKPTEEFGDPVLARHLADFIDALCLDELYMMGNSMGAYGVAKYAVDHPDRVKKMVLVASGSIAAAMGLEHAPTDWLDDTTARGFTPQSLIGEPGSVGEDALWSTPVRRCRGQSGPGG